ncbi:PAQR family membrane homeostasis protein TrhA [Nakamurella deserti]|uniref:PAQR family membrane homeostasis protein TrhA n=1 Tax=Nakamurella deserti TaxID=2164074 RepID=UPI000DBE93DB|nr:hemolysin III family protein [Nakamurella deserti]
MRSTVMGTTTTPRPRAKGWIHFYSAPVAAVVGITLTTVAATTLGTRAALACAVYTVTIIGLFTVSATYHRRIWATERARVRMKRLDHAMIFLFIAGTYTPLTVLALPPGSAGWVLPVVWAGALGGATLKLSWSRFPRWLGVPIYLALGWVAVFLVPELHSAAGDAPVLLVCAGGLLYTVGTAIFATRRPDPWPAVFGFHEMFHACVSLAAACHCVAIWLVLFD